MPKISELSAATGITADDLLVIVNDPNNVGKSTQKATAQSLSDFVLSNPNYSAGITLETGSFSTGKISISSAILDLKAVEDTNIFTVPNGYMFLIDSMEVITTNISGTGESPTVRFGNSSVRDAYYASTQISSSALVGYRHVIESPQNAILASTTFSFGIVLASGYSTHEGVAVASGYLVKIS